VSCSFVTSTKIRTFSELTKKSAGKLRTHAIIISFLQQGREDDSRDTLVFQQVFEDNVVDRVCYSHHKLLFCFRLLHCCKGSNYLPKGKEKQENKKDVPEQAHPLDAN
jgi:hypothetical protein